jgi:hypothetical protein
MVFSGDQHSPYSFVSICAWLGLDAEDIRNKLKYGNKIFELNRFLAKNSSIARNKD